MRVGAWALMAVLLTPHALSQAPHDAVGLWSQEGGDAQHTREAPTTPYPLDVVSTGRLLEGAERLVSMFPYLMPLALTTSAGTFLMAYEGPRDTAVCTLVRADALDPPTTTRASSGPCPDTAWLAGAHEGAGLVFVCLPGPSGIARIDAVDASSLEVRWTHTLDAPAAVETPGMSGTYTDSDCTAIVEPDGVIVAFSSFANNRVDSLGLDGELRWSTVVPGSVVANLAAPSMHELDPLGAPGFTVWHLTSMEGGYLAFGSITGAPAMAWMDTEGRVLASHQGSRDPSGTGAGEGRAGHLDAAPAVARGDTALAIVGQHFVTARTGSLSAMTEPIPAAPGIQPPVWWRDHYAYSSTEGVTIVTTPQFGDAWSYAMPRPTLLDMLVTERGELLLASKRSDSADDGALSLHVELSWVDLERRTESRRLPLPPIPYVNAASNVFGYPKSQLIPLEGGRILFLTADGDYALLGEADPALAPRPVADDPYPLVGAAATLRVEPPPGTTRTILAWDDGIFEDARGTVATHVYAEPGERVVRTTAVFEDGRTATSESRFFVGAQPPAKLTAIQRAFSPDNQEVTFFLLGLALTGGGALFAAGLRRQRHARLTHEERKLRAVIDASLLEPTKGLAALDAHRAHLRDEHTRRRLDDAQFGLLDSRAVRAMKSARYRLLGHALNKLTPHFRRLLDTALEDGQVTTGEMAALVAALDEEPALDAATKEKLRALLSSWSR